MTACVPLVLGGAAVGTGMVAMDRRTSETILIDEGIELRAASRIRDNVGSRGHINITSYNKQVLLTGEVPTPEDKQLLEQIVSQVDNVKSVVNETEVMVNSTVPQRANDVLTTTRVKANILDAKDLFSNAYKVVTERGITYLMGRVTNREASRATDVTRSSIGVKKVVRIFEILTEEELQGIGQKPTP